MAGIYIHIPFCRKACDYCNFHFSTQLDKSTAVYDAIEKEIRLRENYLPFNDWLKSIYFGGGTPSLVPLENLERILNQLYKVFNFVHYPEITLEINPDDCNLEYMEGLKQIGINRLSIGVQSFFDNDLAYLGRIHDANQAYQVIEDAHKADFKNLTVDLMYGLPVSTQDQWEANLKTLKHYEVPHFSAYALTIEPKTLLNHKIQKGEFNPPDEDRYKEDFKALKNFIKNQGYEHYEIANIALPGFKAIHNTNYWFGKPYLGIGPGAHSFDGQIRSWNVSNNPIYLKALQGDQLANEQEVLSHEDLFNEAIMTGLRTTWGIDLANIRDQFGDNLHKFLVDKMNHWEEKGAIIKNEEKAYLSPDHTLLADSIIADCFYVS